VGGGGLPIRPHAPSSLALLNVVRQRSTSSVQHAAFGVAEVGLSGVHPDSTMAGRSERNCPRFASTGWACKLSCQPTSLLARDSVSIAASVVGVSSMCM
jgi:hypothetical protein